VKEPAARPRLRLRDARDEGETLRVSRANRSLRWIAIGGCLPPIVVLAIVVGCEHREVGKQRETSSVVARVNGRELFQRDFESYLPAEYREAMTLKEKKAYLDRWITTELLYGEAMERGLATSPEIEARLEQLRKDLVADQLVREILNERAVVTEREVREYYRAHEDEYTRELRVSHILVSTPEEAEKVKELLRTHEFSWVVDRYSVDKHTGAGGDLGFLSKGNMIPEFEDVVFKMNVGDVSDVIQTEFGYHFVTVTDAREAQEKLTLEDAAEDISRTVLLQKRKAVYDGLVAGLRARAKIEILDPEFRMAAEAPADTLPGYQEEPDSTFRPGPWGEDSDEE
jgi:peptidyl-prolyl cis-trans isomerase C